MSDDRSIVLAKEVHDLMRKCEQQREMFLRTVLAIVSAMPDDPEFGYPIVRVSEVDFHRAYGRVLETALDRVTGDQVFISRPLREEGTA